MKKRISPFSSDLTAGNPYLHGKPEMKQVFLRQVLLKLPKDSKSQARNVTYNRRIILSG